MRRSVGEAVVDRASIGTHTPAGDGRDEGDDVEIQRPATSQVKVTRQRDVVLRGVLCDSHIAKDQIALHVIADIERAAWIVACVLFMVLIAAMVASRLYPCGWGPCG